MQSFFLLITSIDFVAVLISVAFEQYMIQCAKNVMSDSPGLVDFAISLVIFVLNLPDRQVLFWGGNSNYRRIVINPANQKGFGAS